MSQALDAIIVGGGPAGATAALLLAKAGWSVAVMERAVFPRRKVCGEYLSATNLPLLDRLGVGQTFREDAGPEVQRVGLFVGDTAVTTDLPFPRNGEWGRALSRERLDSLLLQRAAEAGATVLQPWNVVALHREGDHYCVVGRSGPNETEGLHRARVILAAHGSWGKGELPTLPQRKPAEPWDLLGFKAHFQQASLSPGLMPLLSFPGGYGGLVHCESGRVSLSCCIRRDQLRGIRQGEELTAGDQVLRHILQSCRGAREALSAAQQEGNWLSTGPIRPGFRLPGSGGLFLLGNAAGEAHPVIAEGISMAIQSAGLLASTLIQWKQQSGDSADLARAQRRYATTWHRAFVWRAQASRVIAHWAMRPRAVAWTLPFIRWFPRTLCWGARISGKATLLSRFLNKLPRQSRQREGLHELCH